jgi:hypothetical protein
MMPEKALTIKRIKFKICQFTAFENIFHSCRDSIGDTAGLWGVHN